MKKIVPTVSSGKQMHPILGFLRVSGNKGSDYLILGTIELFILALLLYWILMWPSKNSKIQYTPEDIVYGEKIHAVHDMGTNRVSQRPGYTPTDFGAHPEIQLSETYHDFGKVDADQVLTRTFVIANSGQFPLVIQRAYTTCGCTVADFTASMIPPGKVVLITIQLDTGYHDMHGTTVRRGVMIETNDPDHPIQEIWIQASVR